MRLDGRENCKLYDQVRVIEFGVKEFESMRSSALDNVERGRRSAQERVILPDMSHVSVFKGVNQ